MSPTLNRCIQRFLLSVALLALSGVGLAAEVLRVLTWPGYADADLVQAFEQRTGAQVVVTLIDSDEALWQKISAGRGQDFDVLALNTAELRRCIQAGLVQPVHQQKIGNIQRQLPRFRDLPALLAPAPGQRVFGVPYTYSEMGLIYDRKQMAVPPQSIAALWDRRWANKVLLYNGASHNFSLAALAIGEIDPFHIPAERWPTAVHKLIDLRRNAMRFYTQPDESVRLFRDKKAALLFANYGSQQVQLLRAAGVDVGYVIPREGALAWLDVWAVSRGARNLALAQAWINYMLEPAPSAALVTRQGLANTIQEPAHLHTADRLLWLTPVEDVERRNELWQRIYSGDNADKVLAP